MAYISEYVKLNESDSDAVIQAAVDTALESYEDKTLYKAELKYTNEVDQGDQEILISLIGDENSTSNTYKCSFVRFLKDADITTVIEVGVLAGINSVFTGSGAIQDHDTDISDGVDSNDQEVAFLTVLYAVV